MGDAADDLAAWELLDELGRGAMGTVHRARRRVDGREVALKLVPLARGPRRARFLREGETLARLCHPAIVRIHSLHLGLARGVIELELVEGEPLVDLLNRRGRLGPEEALRIIEEVARGAHHAHEHGVVHRDLKPANVVIAADGRPRILDFGVAKDLEAVERLSQTGTLLGTPTYFAPEQAVGAVDRVGPKVDVWALGVMLWELLEGRPPFEATSMHRLVALLVSVEPPRPRLADGRDAGETGTIALLAMSKDPAERPTALELAELCARARSAGPRLRRPGPVAVRVVGLVLLVVAAMTTGTVVALAARGVGAAPALAVGDPPRTVDGAESEPTRDPTLPELAAALQAAVPREEALGALLPALARAVELAPAARGTLALALPGREEDLVRRLVAGRGAALGRALALLDEGPGADRARLAWVRAVASEELGRAAVVPARELLSRAVLGESSPATTRLAAAAAEPLWRLLAADLPLGPAGREALEAQGRSAHLRLAARPAIEAVALLYTAGVAVEPPQRDELSPEATLEASRDLLRSRGGPGVSLAAAACYLAAVQRAMRHGVATAEAHERAGDLPLRWLSAARLSAPGALTGPRWQALAAIERREWAQARARGLLPGEAPGADTGAEALAALEAARDLGYARRDILSVDLAQALAARAEQLSLAAPEAARDAASRAVELARAAASAVAEAPRDPRGVAAAEGTVEWAQAVSFAVSPPSVAPEARSLPHRVEARALRVLLGGPDGVARRGELVAALARALDEAPELLGEATELAALLEADGRLDAPARRAEAVSRLERGLASQKGSLEERSRAEALLRRLIEGS